MQILINQWGEEKKIESTASQIYHVLYEMKAASTILDLLEGQHIGIQLNILDFWWIIYVCLKFYSGWLFLFV